MLKIVEVRKEGFTMFKQNQGIIETSDARFCLLNFFTRLIDEFVFDMF